MPAQDIQNQLNLEPSKFEHVRKELRKNNIEFSESDYEIFILHNGKVINIYPYSGYFEGIGINPGKGIENLLKQINENCNCTKEDSWWNEIHNGEKCNDCGKIIVYKK